jgi:hypothetical protein
MRRGRYGAGTYRRLCRRLEKLERNVRNNRHFMARETDYSALVPK